LFKNTSVVDIFLAVVISNLMSWESLNLMLIGPPGSGKTEMANFIDRHPAVYVADNISAHSFISGYQESKRKAMQVSLLNDLKQQNKRILIFKDMSTLLGMNNDAKRDLISQMRRISDGQLSRVVGNRMSFSWKGKLGFIAMATPQIDANIDIIRELGERWIYWRLEPQHMPSPNEIAKKAQSNVGREGSLRLRITDATIEFLDGIIRGYNGKRDEDRGFDTDSEWSEEIRKVAILTSNLKMVVGRNFYTRDLAYKPYVESPARITRYYTQLAMCLSIISNQKVNKDIVDLVKRSAVYSLPALGTDILRELYKLGDGRIMTIELARNLNIPEKTAKNILEDYQIAGITSSMNVGGDLLWTLTDKIYNQIRETGILDLDVPVKQSKIKKKEASSVVGW